MDMMKFQLLPYIIPCYLYDDFRLSEAKPNVSVQIAQSSSSTIEISHIFALLQYAYGTNPIVQKLRFLNYSCMKIGLSSYLWKLQMSIVIRYLI